MSEHPILFSGPMVRALLDGTKTQTRRVIKDQSIGERFSHMTDTGLAHLEWLGTPSCGSGVWDVPEYSTDVACPYGQPGDRLWVREAWRVAAVHDHVPGSELGYGQLTQVQYEAIGDGRDETQIQWGRYRHARFMPRWASRITLEITTVRVERLQAISEADAIAEGIVRAPYGWWSGKEGASSPTAQGAYALLWESINGPGSWDANPWVWVVEFKRVTP